jgi:HEPN domain-containing protein
MLRVSMSSTNNQSLAINFLNFAVRNYISARILYLNNQLHDAGVMSHEAFEKVMKALIYF